MGRVTYALFFIVKTTRRIPKPRTKQCFEGIRGKEKAMQQHDDILLPPLSLPDFSKQPKVRRQKGNAYLVSMAIQSHCLLLLNSCKNMVNELLFFYIINLNRILGSTSKLINPLGYRFNLVYVFVIVMYSFCSLENTSK